MRSRLIVFLILIVGVCAILYLQFSKKQAVMLNPQTLQTDLNDLPTPSLSPAPIIFHFDQSTNLKQQLDMVNPKVSSDDFADLKNLISSINK